MCTIFCAILLAASAPVEAPKPIATIDDLWLGFDPRSVPLDVEVLKSWEEDDVHLESFYFTGEVFEGEKVRIFGYLGRPKKVRGKIPGVLHIHGGGQTAVLDWPRFWAKRGYACLSFDFCGDLGPGSKREQFTRWGKVQADMTKIGGGLSMKPTPRHNPWYHWTLAARRGLTLLESRAEVDKDRLGIFGISVGGTLTWSVAALDTRVKAAAPIYGGGWEFYHYPPDLSADPGYDLKSWRTMIAPEAHAARVKCPLLYLSATNDGHGRMDLAYRTLERVPGKLKNQVFTPNTDHHVEPGEARSLPLFMGAHLRGDGRDWPESPGVRFDVDRDGVPFLKVDPVRSNEVERVDIHYCLNNDWPTTRFWRTVPSTRHGNSFTGAAPILNRNDVLFAFANVTYKSGLRISSTLLKQDASKLAGAKATLARTAMIDSMESSRDWSWVPAYTDPCRDDRFFEEWKGPTGERGFTLDRKTFNHAGGMIFHFGTRKIGDPQFHGVGRKTLLLDHLADHSPEKVIVRLLRRVPGQNPVEFTTLLPPAAGEGPWKTWRMEAAQFKDVSGKALENWDRIESFVLTGTSPANKPPIIKRLRWQE